jgi:hypothetical protein
MLGDRTRDLSVKSVAVVAILAMPGGRLERVLSAWDA